MSLINDALKRARQAQDKAPAPEDVIPHLRPVESAPTGLRGAGLVLPIVLTLVALGGLFFLWQAAPNNIPAQAAARHPEPQPGAIPVETPSTTSPSVTMEQGRSGTRPDQEETAAPAPSMNASNSATVQIVSAATNAPVVPVSAESAPVAAASTTNLSAAVPAPVAKPALPRLQAIVFNPTRPSAIISGKTLFIGDRLGEYRVLAIQQASATLASTTHTNILTLSE